MKKYLTSKIAFALCFLLLIGIGFFVYRTYQKKTLPTLSSSQQQEQDSSSSLSSTDDLTNDSDSDEANNSNAAPAIPDPVLGDSNSSAPAPSTAKTPPISSTKEIVGSMLAHITPQHCDDGCQAFANDLSLYEYCQQVCGISPIKKVTSCDDKKDIQKDYCLKDLAITNKDISTCSQIKDANIKETCKNRITQDIIENQ